MPQNILEISCDVLSNVDDFASLIQTGHVSVGTGKYAKRIELFCGNTIFHIQTRDPCCLLGNNETSRRVFEAAKILMEVCTSDADTARTPERERIWQGLVSGVAKFERVAGAVRNLTTRKWSQYYFPYVPKGAIAWRFGPAIFLQDEKSEDAVKRFAMQARAFSGIVDTCSISFFHDHELAPAITKRCPAVVPMFPFDEPYYPLLAGANDWRAAFLSGIVAVMKETKAATHDGPIRLILADDYGKEICQRFGIHRGNPFTPADVSRILHIPIDELPVSRSGKELVVNQVNIGYRCARDCAFCKHAARK